MKPIKIMTIGGATQDIFLQQGATSHLQTHTNPDNKTFLLLEEGTKIEIASVHYAVGGGAANSAVSFKRQGCTVSSFFKIGTDSQGKFILNQLKQEGGINIDNHAVSTTKQTGTSYILPSPTGNRTVLAYRGANTDLKEADIPLPALSQHDYFYITSLSEQSAHLLPIIVKSAHKTGAVITINPGASQLKTDVALLIEALNFVDTLILNASEARILFQWLLQHKKIARPALSTRKPEAVYKKIPDLLRSFFRTEEHNFALEDYVQSIHALGPTTVIVTNGPEGVYVSTSNILYFHPSVPVTIKNTVGAGDAFGSTFFASMLQGYPTEEAILRGATNSAQVLQHMDAQAGLLTKQELDNLVKEYRLEKLQKYIY